MTTLALFRPPGKMRASAEAAEACGYRVLQAPALLPTEIHDPRWEEFVEGLRAHRWTWAVFTSTVGVEIAVRRLRGLPGIAPHPFAGTRVLAIGGSTRGALESSGIKVDAVPPETNSGGITKLLSRGELKGTRVALLRSSEGVPALPLALASLGAEVLDIQLYRISPPPDLQAVEAFLEKAATHGIDVYAFTSRLTVLYILAAARERGKEALLREAMGRATVAAIGIPTREALEAEEIRVDVTPPHAAFDELLRAIAERVPP